MKISRKAQCLLVAAAFSIVDGMSHAQSPAPDWQTAAGGKMAFDVASVKPNNSHSKPKMNFPMNGGDSYTPTGGVFSASSFPLIIYMAFAYKITGSQWPALEKQLPGWATEEGFDIEARSENHNPTKDQMRLMMQSLLADRFKLAVHTETQQTSVLALELAKPGKLGPHLQQHPANDTTCASAAPPSADVWALAPTVAGGFPASCGGILRLPDDLPGHFRYGARNVPISVIAGVFGAMPMLSGHPIIDGTGLTGTFDFVIEYTSEGNSLGDPGAGPQADTSGPTVVEALKDQLGLKLAPEKHAFDLFVVDHVEKPSAN